jgi:hypothetical protein
MRRYRHHMENYATREIDLFAENILGICSLESLESFEAETTTKISTFIAGGV